MSDVPAVQLPDLRLFRKRCWLVGGVCLALFALGALLRSPAQFFHSYFVGFILWTNLTLGCLAVLMMQHLTGGVWGILTRRILESATRTLPLIFVLFLPVLLGMGWLYCWTDAERVHSDPILQHKSVYLNVGFFILRAIVYFVIWGVLVYLLNRWSLEQDRTADPRLSKRMAALSAPGEVLYGLTASFAAIDWVMSMEPHWHSTIFAPLFATGQMLGGLALTIFVATWLARVNPGVDFYGRRVFQDLGSLLLAFVLLWAYMSFSQFLLIWMANKKDEVPFYVQRLHGGWQGFALMLVFFHFAVPLFLLLMRGLKRSTLALGTICLGLLIMRFLDLEWVIIPSYERSRPVFAILDLLAVAGVGGIWLAVFLAQLTKRPLLPQNDPYWQEALAYARK